MAARYDLATDRERAARALLEGAEMTPLSRAIEVAVRAHDGQVDLAGEPYIFHPLRVMESFRGGYMTKERREDAMIAGVLHDVMEDCPDGKEMIGSLGLPVEVYSALRKLTRAEGEPYTDYLRRVVTDELAMRVKLADLADNMRDDRAGMMREDRLNKYRAARDFITSAWAAECALREIKG